MRFEASVSCLAPGRLLLLLLGLLGLSLGVLLSLALGAVPSAAQDSQRVWSFEIRALVEISPQTHVIRLSPAPSGIHYPRTCKEFVIQAHFQSGVGVPDHLKPFFTEEGYGRAIRHFQDAMLDGGVVRLGSIDRGFGKAENTDDECVVLSAGLAILLDPERRPAVYSVY